MMILIMTMNGEACAWVSMQSQEASAASSGASACASIQSQGASTASSLKQGDRVMCVGLDAEWHLAEILRVKESGWEVDVKWDDGSQSEDMNINDCRLLRTFGAALVSEGPQVFSIYNEQEIESITERVARHARALLAALPPGTPVELRLCPSADCMNRVCSETVTAGVLHF